ncbi:MAG: glycoside hydrolase family 16 protein [Spirochaetales bacterium]|nr:glycoside hydrolase family 16 protein [Spirochaetales bacterium]
MKSVWKYVFALALILAMVPGIAFPEDAKGTGNDNKKDAPKLGTDHSKEDWQLVWNDEFEGEGLADPAKWTYEVWKPGKFNNELNSSTKRVENCRQEKGNLVVEARMDNFEGSKYSAARIKSKYKGDFLYGKFEFRAKLPRGRGTWAALWALPTNEKKHGVGWPSCGEVDVMECVGYLPDQIQTTIHTAKYNHKQGNDIHEIEVVPDMYDEFHSYIWYWYPDRMEIAVDDKVIMVYEDEGSGWLAWPFDTKCYLIINLVIGGDWGGVEGVDDTIFPTAMYVDYVRIFQLESMIKS